MGLIDVLASGVETGGQPANGASVYFYRPRTLEKVTVYQEDPSAATREGRSPATHANPATLDADGKIIAYANVPLRLVVQTSAGVTLRDIPLVGEGGVYADEVLNDTALQAYFTGTTVSADLIALALSLGGIDGKLKVTNGAERYVKSWAMDVQNVVNLGASTGGSVDATSAFQQARDNLGTSGGCIFVPPGTYSLTSVAFAGYSDITILGCGSRTILKQSGTAAAVLDFTGACLRCSVQNLQLQGAGTTGTTGAIGVQFSTSSQDVSVRNVLFSAPSTATGFNVALNCGATRAQIDGCLFYSVKASASATCIKLDGAADVYVSGCDLRCNDGVAQSAYGIAQITTAGSGRIHVSQCRVDQATTAGVYLLAAHESSVVQCSIYGSSTSTGVYNNGSDDMRVSECYVTGGRYGIAFTCTGVGYGFPERGIIANNVVTGTGYHGIWLTSSSATGVPINVLVRGNQVHAAGRVGIFGEACESCQFFDNTVTDSSTSSSGGYGSIVIATANVGGHLGGLNNVVGGNRVYYTSTNYSRAALEIESYAGDGTNVQTTRVLPNDLFPMGPNAVWLRYAGANNACWNASLQGPSMLPQIAGHYGARMPTGVISGNATLALQDSGKTFLVTAAAAITLPTLTAATTDQNNFVEYTIFRTVAAGAITIACGGGNTITRPGSTATTTFTLDVAAASCITIRGYNGTWNVINAAPDYASATYTSA